MKSKTLLLIAAMYVSVTSSAWADEQKALSTSGLIELSYKDDKGTTVKTCAGKKAAFGQTYVSIGVEKLTVNKSDGIIARIVNSDRQVFSAANLKASYKSQTLSVSKVGKPVALSGATSSVDLGVQWGLLDRIPWILRDASLEIRVGYGANSSVEGIVDAFNGITSAIPGYSISTSLATGFAITNAIDKLLFASDRTINLLRANRDLPLLAGQLCEGYYATFSAENSSSYEKYYKGSVVWTGNDLEYNGAPIHDVSYSVVSVKISDRFYPSAKDSFNDSSRGWTGKYRDVLSSLTDLTWISTSEEIAEKEKSIRSNLLEARTLLGSDLDITQQEKQEIHEYAQNEAIKQLKIVKETRLGIGNKVTKESTAAAVASVLSRNSSLVDSIAMRTAQRILENPTGNLPDIPPNVARQLGSSVRNIETAIRLQ